ncbi:MAG TPA: sensor domain-containing diguanylate cyclase [bacterium]|nr:sensor domain-containing diguanylate cyclase [bacterium]
MLKILKLENLSFSQKWISVLGSTLLATVVCYLAAQRGEVSLSLLLLFYVPLALSTVLLGLNLTAALAIAIVVISLLTLISISAPAWILATFFLGLAVNYTGWYRWIRAGELEDFQRRKTGEELDLAMNDARIAHEKVKIAHQSNQLKIQRYIALNELARSLAMTLKTQEVVVFLIETISKTFMASGGVYTLLLFDNSMRKSLHAVRYSVDTEMEVRLNRERLNPDEIFNAWVVAQTKPLFLADTLNDFRFQNYSPENKIRSLVSAPFMAGNEMLGLIRMESCLPSAFRQEDARLLSIFCDLGTVALEHAALYRQTIELAITDGLTGLYVQRYYKDRVRDEVFRALEHKLPLCLMMIDVDKFKGYNDKYGHLTGDKVLRVVAQILKETVRTVDLVARYGGEEFSVLLLKTPWSGAKTVAERIRQKVEAQEIAAGHETTHITVSIGVAELNPSFKDVESFVDSADQALYQAKADGRNCVRFAKTGSPS